MLFFFSLQRRGERVNLRKIAVDNFIPIQTLRDTLKRPPTSDGYPNFGRQNKHKKLLTTSEEEVSFIYYYLLLFSYLCKII